MSGLVSRLLAHPLTRGLPVDDPSTTVLRRRIVREKPFLNAIYREWYSRLLSLMPTPGTVLEIGSGAGFLKELRPDVITSEVFCTPGVDAVADGRCLPFLPISLDGVVMTDVFHHIPDVACVSRRGGTLLSAQRTSGDDRALANEVVRVDLQELPPGAIRTRCRLADTHRTAVECERGIVVDLLRAGSRTFLSRISRVAGAQAGTDDALSRIFFPVVCRCARWRQAPGWSYPFCRALESVLAVGDVRADRA